MLRISISRKLPRSHCVTPPGVKKGSDNSWDTTKLDTPDNKKQKQGPQASVSELIIKDTDKK